MNTIPTNEGYLTIKELMEELMYSSYAANRSYGMTHDELLTLGIGNEQMKVRYESNNYTQQIPIL